MRGNKVKELVRKECFIKDEQKAKIYLAGVRKNAVALIGIINLLLEKGTVSQVEINKKFNSGALKKLIDEDIVKSKEVVVRRKPYQIVEGNNNAVTFRAKRKEKP